MAHALEDYEVSVFDESFTRVISTSAVTKVEWAERWADKAGWLLECDTGSDLANTLAATRNARIAVHHGTTQLFSGVVSGSREGTSLTQSVSIQDGFKEDATVFSGRDYNALLDDRIIVPEEGQSHLIADGEPATVATAVAAYVTRNPSQAIPDLDWVSPAPSGAAPVAFRFRYSKLLPALRKICIAGALNVRVDQEGRRLIGRVATSRDQSGNVIFSAENGSLLDAQISRTPVEVTRAYMAGQGEGAARRIVIVEDGNAPYLVEQFFDRRDIETDAELRTEGLIALDEGRGGHSLTVSPDAFSVYDYPTDYTVGDLVSVNITGAREVQRVTQVTTTITADGLVRSVQIGAVPRAGAEGLLGQIQTFDNRLSNVETSP